MNKQEIILEAKRCLSCVNPKCEEGCPLHNRIKDFLIEVKNNNFDSAYKILLTKNTMPEICGLVCAHEKQCEGHCIQNINGAPIKIGNIENFIANEKIENKNYRENILNKNNKKVCAIGSGPASISFALKMIEAGYNVDIFEKENFFGGILNSGIPFFRLNKNYIQNIKNYLEKNGAKIFLNSPIYDIKKIQENYDAIFLGLGALSQNDTNTEGRNLKNIFQSSEFLKDFNLNLSNEKMIEKYGKKIIVVGGGNAAMDSARSAKKLNEDMDVKIIYRRTEKEMPACKEELINTKKENIEFLTLTNPTKFIGEEKVNKIECAIMELGEPDETGRRSPIESNKEHIYFSCDSAILAFGSKVDPTFAIKNNIEIDNKNRIIVDENFKTNLKNIYAGGDCVFGAATVVEAVKSGKIAAENFIKNN